MIFLVDYSIVIAVPTFNSKNLLPNLIQSLKNQTNFNWKIIFIDGSTSLTQQKGILRISQEEANCFYLREDSKKKGIYNAMNLAFDYVKKDDWLLFWGSDDWAYSDYVIEKITSQISENTKKKISPDLIVYAGEYINCASGNVNRKTLFTNKYEIFNSNQFRKRLFWGFSLPHQATLFSPKVRMKLNKYSTSLILAADLDYFLKLSKFNDLKIQSLPISIISISDNGISSRRIFLRYYEVMISYFKAFGILFIIPFLSRYLRRYFSLRTIN